MTPDEVCARIVTLQKMLVAVQLELAQLHLDLRSQEPEPREPWFDTEDKNKV